MTRINKITLVTEQETTDSIGQIITTETQVEVVGEVRSVTQNEYMTGRQSGLTPAYVFRVSVFGYSGQNILIYDNVRYSIYRSYEADDNYIELYTEAQLGVTNG